MDARLAFLLFMDAAALVAEVANECVSWPLNDAYSNACGNDDDGQKVMAGAEVAAEAVAKPRLVQLTPLILPWIPVRLQLAAIQQEQFLNTSYL